MTQIIKQIYEKPTMKVVKLDNRHHLLLQASIPVDSTEETDEQW